MSQIYIEIKKELSENYPNVISTSFFTMKDAYRSFTKYENALKHFLEHTKQLDNFEVRIYTDDSGIDYALKVSQNMENVSIYKFDCPEFKDDNYHIGTFGTLVRFMPLFEDHNIVWVSDIDIPSSYLDMNTLHLMEKHKTQIYIQTLICYERKVYGRKQTIVANKFIIKNLKLSKALLTRFLNKILNGSFKNIINDLNNANTRKPPSKVPYGIDEYFMNTSIYDNIHKRSLKIYIMKQYDAEKFIEYLPSITQKDKSIILQNYNNPTKESVSKVKELYKRYIPLILDKYPCLQELLDKLPSFKNDFNEHYILNSNEI
jgi:hypothetical protein